MEVAVGSFTGSVENVVHVMSETEKLHDMKCPGRSFHAVPHKFGRNGFE